MHPRLFAHMLTGVTVTLALGACHLAIGLDEFGKDPGAANQGGAGQAGSGSVGGDGSGAGGAACGNGVVNAGEDCDGGGETALCDDDCTEVVCGDGNLNGTAGEACDDGNTTPGDGCSATCQTKCGNGALDNGEGCDDGNTAAGDGCDGSCQREAGACCTGAPSVCTEGPFTIGGSSFGITIPDGGFPGNTACVEFTFPQTGCGSIVDVDVTTGISHTWLGDLIVAVGHPATMNVQRLLNQAGAPPGTSDGSNLSSTSPITFDDGVAYSAETMGAGLSDNAVVCQDDAICQYDPDPDNLAGYIGMPPEGSWEFCIGDASPGDAGTLEEVQFIITTQ